MQTSRKKLARELERLIDKCKRLGMFEDPLSEAHAESAKRLTGKMTVPELQQFLRVIKHGFASGQRLKLRKNG